MLNMDTELTQLALSSSLSVAKHSLEHSVLIMDMVALAPPVDANDGGDFYLCRRAFILTCTRCCRVLTLNHLAPGIRPKQTSTHMIGFDFSQTEFSVAERSFLYLMVAHCKLLLFLSK